MRFRALAVIMAIVAVIFSLSPASSQTKVTLNLHNVPFEQVINVIRQQTVYRFVYSAEKLPEKSISVYVKNEEAVKVLDGLLAGTRYASRLLENNLIVISLRNKIIPEHIVTGLVTDENNHPIANASVVQKNGRYGTVTDQYGKFTINLPERAGLRISYIGYRRADIIPEGDKPLSVVLQADSTTLNEVIVTALNIRKEDRKIGYAVSSVKGKELTRAREANMIMSLEGQVAGLNISGVHAGPSSSSRVLLRGAVSMTAGSPLFVLNGVPIDNTQRGSANEYGGADYGDGISNINPDDIDDITILKGSAASALYGARAANGIILITTKSGAKNTGLAVGYNTNTAVDRAVDNRDFQYIYGQGSQNRRPADKESAIASGLLSWGEPLDGLPTIQFDGNTYPYSAVRDNISTFYRTAPSFTNTVSVTGGSAKGTFRMSASNLDYNSILRKSGLNRKTFNLNTSYDVSSHLEVSFTGNYIYEFGKNRSYLSDGPVNANYGIEFLANSARQESLAPGYDRTTGMETLWNNDVYKTNPWFVVNKQVDNSKRNRFISSTVVKYKFSDEIYLQGRLGYDISNDDLLNVVPWGAAFTINQQGTLNGLNKSQTSELNSDLLFSANKSISRGLDLSVSLGGNFRKRQYDLTGFKGSQFITPYLYTPNNLVSISSDYKISRLVTESAYYTADLDYHHFFTLSTTGRYDIYSTLPSGNRGIFVPGVSGSFVFSDLMHIPGLTYGKLRMSFAKTSGEPAEPYTTKLYFSSDKTVNGVPMGDFSLDLPNYNLKPFTLNEFETGFHLSFLNSRLDLDVSYFNRVTHNEIINAEQSVTTGFTSAYVNLGKTKNTGIEFSSAAHPLNRKDFSWSINANVSSIRNKLVSIDGSSKYVLTGTYRPLNANTALVAGKPITQIMAYDYRRDASGNVIIGSDGIPLRGDFKAMGSTLPDLYGGLTNTFRYRNFSLSFLIDFKSGNKILSATEDYSYVYGLNKATLAGRENGITANGVTENGEINTKNVAAYNYYPQLATNISALSVLNGSFIKFRQLILGYTFPHQFMQKTFQSVSADLVCRNLFTLLKYTKNIDPESEFSPNLTYAGIEGASLPAVRTLGFNINFKFK